MSRIIVKNLHKKASEGELRKVFTSKGQITDIQLRYTPEGKFRNFAFIGYTSEESANQAQAFYNQTFIGPSKVTVEICTHLGSVLKSKRETHTKKNAKKIQKQQESSEALKKVESESGFQQFLVSHSQKKKPLWANEEGDVGEEQEDEEEERKEAQEEEEDISDLEYLKSKIVTKKAGSHTNQEDKKMKYEFKYKVKIRGIPQKTKRKELKKFLLPLKAKSLVYNSEQCIAYVGCQDDDQLNTALSKHRTYLGANRLSVYQHTSAAESGRVAEADVRQKWSAAEAALQHEETLAESGRLFIRNLSYSVDEKIVTELFKQYGEITEVNLPVDRDSRQLKGFGTVTFMFPEHAVKAYEEMDGYILQGRVLHILPAKQKPAYTPDTDGMSHRQKKLVERKATAMSAHNWNTLFLGANTVADVTASKFKKTKQEVLSEGSGGNVAVRMALAETSLVAETRDFLIDNGVHLDAFNQNVSERSSTVLIIKNLPAATKDSELIERFSHYGELGRVLLPTSGVTALVEFLEATEARRAFRGLAYTKFKHVPLYLEWAPHNVFNKPHKRQGSKKASTDNADATEEKEASKAETEAVQSEKTEADQSEETKVDQSEKTTADQSEKQTEVSEVTPEQETTLFVKNVNFTTTDEDFKQHFQCVGGVVSAVVSRKRDVKKGGSLLSMGYGFVQYKVKAGARRALKELQHSTLDEHELELKVSNRTTQRAEQQTGRKEMGNKQQKSSKILVRNVPFQANKHEITQLFKTFGELKDVRLPKKFAEGAHRGFAFVEFLTRQHAKQAFSSLCQSTHLYGRRLVLEWAESEETVETLRRKTAEQYQLSDEPLHKKSKSTVSVNEILQADKE